jgi:hypothetical protein
MIKNSNKYYSLVLLMGCHVILLLSACTSTKLPTQSAQNNDQKVTQSSSSGEKTSNSRSLPYQGNLLDVDGLLSQLKKTDANLELQSKRLLKVALDAQANNDWGAAAKGFGESIAFIPTNEALLGYAMSRIMTNVHTVDPKESLSTKLRNFQEAIKIYQVAIEFSQRANKLLSNEQRQLVKTNVACLESFLQSPDPKAATCKLVADALKASKIN